MSEAKDHTTKLKKLNDVIKQVLENEGEIEIRDAYLKRAEYELNEMKDNNIARATYKLALEKTASQKKQLEIQLIILQTFYLDGNIPEF